jgi:hypothetical protein
MVHYRNSKINNCPYLSQLKPFDILPLPVRFVLITSTYSRLVFQISFILHISHLSAETQHLLSLRVAMLHQFNPPFSITPILLAKRTINGIFNCEIFSTLLLLQTS